MRAILFALSFLVASSFAARSFSSIGTNLVVESFEFPVDVQILFGSTASIDVVGQNGANEKYVYYSESTLSIRAENEKLFDNLSPAMRLGNNGLSLIVSSMLLIIALLGFGRNNMIASCVLVATIAVLSQTASAANESYSVVITLPSTFAGFDSLALNLGSLNSTISVSGGTLRASSLSINAPAVPSLSIQALSITSSLRVIIDGDFTVGALDLTGPSASVNITTNGNVIATLISFIGNADVTYPSTTTPVLRNGQCTWTTTSTNSLGSCSGGTQAFNVNSGGSNVTIDFGSPCNLLVTSYNAPPSPALATTIPAQSFTFLNASKWKANWPYGNANLTQFSATELRLSKGGYTGVQSIVCDQCLPYLRKTATYTFTVDIRLQSNISQTVLLDRVGIYKNRNYRSTGTWDASYTNSTYWLATQSNSASVVNDTNYKTISVQFTVPEDYWSGFWFWDQSKYWEAAPGTTNLNTRYVALALRFSVGNSNIAHSYILRNPTLSTAAEAIPANPALITRESSLAVIPHAPALTGNPNVRTNCPWNITGAKNWRDTTIWPGGVLPNPNSEITLPENMTVLVDACSFLSTDVYRKIIVPASSHLAFVDAPITLNLIAMMVQGRFSIGSETCRVFSKITINFIGAKPGGSIPDDISVGMGTKGIGVHRGGAIDLHGYQYYTWTRLSKTAMPGDTTIWLQDSVNWEVGQRVVVITTFYQDDYWPQNEVMTIAAIGANGRAIQFTQPLTYHHYAGDGEYQAEVGLLDRKINLVGDAQSETGNFGGHVMIMGEGRFSGVRAYRMGQTNQLARYPYHFHTIGECLNCFVHDSSCEHTFYRCVVLHQTSEVDVRSNVAYDVTGFSYYFEDGVEENNTVYYNLAANVHWISQAASGSFQGGDLFQSSPTLAQPADVSAAGFYITNAWNEFVGNAASGGWAGYAFPNLYQPIGVSATLFPNFDPSSRTLKLWNGNTAHSAGYYWGSGTTAYCGGNLIQYANGSMLYNSGRIERETRIRRTETLNKNQKYWWSYGSPSPSPQWMIFNNTKFFLANVGMNHWGNRADLINYEVHDVQRSATLFGESSLVGGLINAESGNPITGVGPTQGFQFYDTWVKTIVSNVTFRNFKNSPAIPANIYGSGAVTAYNLGFIAMTHSDEFKPQGISAATKITYDNCDSNTMIGIGQTTSGSGWEFNFVDYDGSASQNTFGAGVGAIIGSYIDWWRYKSSCVQKWAAWVCPKGVHEIAHIYLNIPAWSNVWVRPDSDKSIPVGDVTLWGDGYAGSARSMPITTIPGTTGISDRGWHFRMGNGTGSPVYFKLDAYNFPVGRSVIASFPYPSGTTFAVGANYTWGSQGRMRMTLAPDFATFQSSTNGTYYFVDSSFLYLKIYNNVQSGAAYTRGGASVYQLQNSYSYYVTATCSQGTGTRSTGGGTYTYCNNSPTSFPTQTLSTYPTY